MSGSGEKTEEPTGKKLRDARDKGQVANSKEVTSALIMIIVSAILYFTFDRMVERLTALITAPTYYYDQDFGTAVSLMSGVMFDEFINITMPIVILAAIAGIAGNFVQIGALLSFDPLVPKYEKIDPVAGFKRIFCMKNFMEFVKSLLKVIVLAVVCVFVIRANLYDMLKIPVCEKHCILRVVGHMMFQLVGISLVAFIVIAAADVAYQNYSHKKDLRMTKDEVKREHKDTDGNPEIKGRRRQIHREILNNEGLSQAVQNSTVVVANPVEIAIAIHYEGGGSITPLVKAKGVEDRAKKIKKYAWDFDVPVMENVDLARTLYAGSTEYRYMKPTLFQPMIQVVIWLEEYRAERGLAPLTSAGQK